MPAIFDGTNGLTFNDGTLMGSAQFSNRIINPNFTVNQRAATGTVVLAAGAYGLDRWKAGASGCTFTFAVSANVTTLTISAGTLMQVIEGANLQSGVHVLSWTGSALGRIDAGSFSASGVTGTASGGTNQTVEFAAGTLVMPRYNQGAASSVQFLPVGLELALSQRYYFRKTTTITINIWGILQAYAAGAAYGKVLDLPVEMRANATINLSNIGHFAPTSSAGSLLTAFTSASTFDASRTAIVQSGGFNGSSGLVAGNATNFATINSAAWMDASAEL